MNQQDFDRRTLPSAPSQRRPRVERGLQEHTFPPNRRMEPAGMADLERWISGLGGATMLWYGMQQRGLSRWSLTVLGAGLIYQGVSGDNLLGYLPMAQDNPVLRSLSSAPTELRVRKSLTINRSANELYTYWRNLENLPIFMKHVKAVHDLGNGRSHWVVEALQNMEMEWDAQITEDRTNEMIAWETLPGAELQNSGYVKFIPTAHGTEVSVSIHYDPPGAMLGRLAGGAVKFIAEQQIKEEIRNFKRLMETGELPTTKGQPAARKEAWRESEHLHTKPRVDTASSETVTVEESVNA
jgi:uncharacterized membrane protein